MNRKTAINELVAAGAIEEKVTEISVRGSNRGGALKDWDIRVNNGYQVCDIGAFIQYLETQSDSDIQEILTYLGIRTKILFLNTEEPWIFDNSGDVYLVTRHMEKKIEKDGKVLEEVLLIRQEDLF